MCILFLDQHLVPEKMEGQILGPNRSAKLVVVAGHLLSMSGQGAGYLQSSNQKERKGRLSGSAVSHDLCFVLQGLFTLTLPVLQSAQVFVNIKARQISGVGAPHLHPTAMVAAVAKAAWKFSF